MFLMLTIIRIHLKSPETGKKAAAKAAKASTAGTNADDKEVVTAPKNDNGKVVDKDTVSMEGVSIDLVQNNQNSALKDSLVKAIEKQNEVKNEARQAYSAKDTGLTGTAGDGADDGFSDNVNKASLSLKELIESAKKKIENKLRKDNKRR